MSKTSAVLKLRVTLLLGLVAAVAPAAGCATHRASSGAASAGAGGGGAAGSAGTTGSAGSSGGPGTAGNVGSSGSAADAGASGTGAGGTGTANGHDAGSTPVGDAGSSTLHDAGRAADGGGAISCDPAKILCKRVAPTCPSGQVPSVSGSCYGDCVPIEACPCGAPEQCPDSNHYTCFKSAAHCGPYV